MARRVKTPKGLIWPAWFYGPEGESVICKTEDEVPEGWARKAGRPEPTFEIATTVILDHDELVAELIARNIRIKPTWGDAHMKRIIDGDVSPTW